jgi:hypothetical protein
VSKVNARLGQLVNERSIWVNVTLEIWCEDDYSKVSQMIERYMHRGSKTLDIYAIFTFNGRAAFKSKFKEMLGKPLFELVIRSFFSSNL